MRSRAFGVGIAPRRFGLVSPVVTLHPRAHGAWEVSAGLSELREVAQAADHSGYDFLTASEHVAMPTAAVGTRGARYYDPLATLGYLAALTSEIRLLPHVVVLPYAHPMAVAKRYGTLDALSQGRVLLGVGVGSLEEEFELLGVDFTARGERYEEALRALRVALDGETPSFHGRFFDFEDFVMEPRAVQARVPLWLGGRSERSLRRALLLGEGWIPFGVSASQLRGFLERAEASPAARARMERRAPALEIVVQPEHPLDLRGRQSVRGCREMLEAYTEIGVTGFKLRFRADTLREFLAQLEVFRHEIADPMRGAGPDKDSGG
ncbi:MAG: TIGR03619 family F420-dependent LLM class oxidoreductase [Candidatus Binatia bacterium]|nr:TIGR03619 family F420-dependent LLM class oxidoreductase [Candidatus Binatia bacterium]MDG2008766.1 TIGR03619 family F420-dependent LLM class oxidoreductase [Candidatus Binatia bacterium]